MKDRLGFPVAGIAVSLNLASGKRITTSTEELGSYQFAKISDLPVDPTTPEVRLGLMTEAPVKKAGSGDGRRTRFKLGHHTDNIAKLELKPIDLNRLNEKCEQNFNFATFHFFTEFIKYQFLTPPAAEKDHWPAIIEIYQEHLEGLGARRTARCNI